MFDKEFFFEIEEIFFKTEIFLIIYSLFYLKQIIFTQHFSLYVHTHRNY